MSIIHTSGIKFRNQLLHDEVRYQTCGEISGFFSQFLLRIIFYCRDHLLTPSLGIVIAGSFLIQFRYGQALPLTPGCRKEGASGNFSWYSRSIPSFRCAVSSGAAGQLGHIPSYPPFCDRFDDIPDHPVHQPDRHVHEIPCLRRKPAPGFPVLVIGW